MELCTGIGMGFVTDQMGPPVNTAAVDRYWFQNGQLHRTDGPAMILADGRQWWHLDGKSMTEDEWRQHVTERYND